MSDNPSNFVYHSNNHSLSWDGVPDAEEYMIASSDYSSGQPNQIIYQGGIATSCPYNKIPGTYYINSKTKPKNGSWGVWSSLVAVVVS